MSYAICDFCGAVNRWKAEKGSKLKDKSCGNCASKNLTKASLEQVERQLAPPRDGMFKKVDIR